MKQETTHVVHLTYICVIIMIYTLVQSHALVYEEFEEFTVGDTLEYGVLSVGQNIEWLQSTENCNGSCLFQLHSFFLDLTQLISAKSCGELHTYLANKTVFLRVEIQQLGLLTHCFEKSDNGTKPKILNQTTILFRCRDFWEIHFGMKFKANELPSFKATLLKMRKLQTWGFRVGCVAKMDEFYDEFKKSLLELMTSGFQIDHITFVLDFKKEMRFYDYQSFVDFCDSQYSNAMIVASRCNNSFSFLIREDNTWYHRYKFLIIKFFHRWGEQRKQLVIYHHPNAANNFCDNHVFSMINHNNPPFIASLKRDQFSSKSFVNICNSMLKSGMICIDFDALLLEFQPNYMLDDSELLNLGDLSSKLSCSFSLLVTLYIDDVNNEKFMKNLDTLINVRKKYPDVFKVYFVASARQCDVDHVYTTQMSKDMKVISTKLPEVSTQKNVSIRLLECIETKLLHESKDNDRKLLFDFHNSASDIITTLKDPRPWVFPRNGIEFDNVFQSLYSYDDNPAYIEVNCRSQSNEDSNECYHFKHQWKMIKSWADLNFYRVVVTENLLIGSESVAAKYCKNWYKSIRHLGKGFNISSASKAELKFLSNFQDTCVSMNKSAPSQPVLISENFSGVTFAFAKPQYSNLRYEEISTMLQLVHTRFKTIEIVLSDLAYLTNILRAISLLEENTEKSRFSGIKYFFNWNATVSLEAIRELKSFRDTTEAFAGLHINICRCTFDLINVQILLKSSINAVGITIGYHEADGVVAQPFWKELVLSIHYIVIRVNLGELLLMNWWLAEAQSSFSSKFYKYVDNHGRDIPPNHVFNNLRGYRFNYRRTNPDIIVYIQIAWPTFNDRKSVERAQKLWAYLHDFSKAFDFPFFWYEAFDQDVLNQSGLAYGWWKLRSDTHLGNPFNYIDKQADYYYMETEMPEIVNIGRTETPSWIALATAIVSFLIVVICITLVVIYKLRQRLQYVLSQEELDEFEMGKTTSSKENEQSNDYYFGLAYNMDRYEIEKHNFNFETSETVGCGNFAVVHKMLIPKFGIFAAVKVPKSIGRTEIEYAIREIKLLSYIGEHENVLTLLGAYTREIRKGITYLVTEYQQNECLLDFLRQLARGESAKSLYNLYQYCVEISNGMDYLSKRKVVHGDLAARNILLSEHMVCKISDFGLARKLYNQEMYEKTSTEPMAWKWMAIETLQRSVISFKSDVWSLGVVFWEIFTFGEMPYSSILSCADFSTKLRDGLRLHKPDMVDFNTYNEMLRCWRINPYERSDPAYFVKYFVGLKSHTYSVV